MIQSDIYKYNNYLFKCLKHLVNFLIFLLYDLTIDLIFKYFSQLYIQTPKK